MQYKLPKHVLDALLAYLKNRPYIEVCQAIPALESLEVLKDE